ncbi:MNIO family bufferin maturase [Vibrio sp. WJH972]
MINLSTNEGVKIPSFPQGSGVSLKPQHFDIIISQQPEIGFFEIHAENYLAAGGPNRHFLEKIRQDYPITVHGVGLSIGGENELNIHHLNQVVELVDRVEPIVFSEHLAWSSHDDIFYNDLLPLPYTEATLNRVCQHIDQVQDKLKRQILLENPATYLMFNQTCMSEIEFIQSIVKRTGCGLLLDINNVAVSCFNHQADARKYLEQFPVQHVEQIHLAGFALDNKSTPPLRIDSHDRPIDDEVWQLYLELLTRHGDIATLIEWDGQLPEFDVFQEQVNQANRYRLDAATTKLQG